MRKILEIFIYAFLGLFFVICSTIDVFASGTGISDPTAITYVLTNGASSTTAVNSYTNWAGKSGYYFQFSQSYSTTLKPNQFYFVTPNLNLCNGDNCYLNGYFQIYKNSALNDANILANSQIMYQSPGGTMTACTINSYTFPYNIYEEVSFSCNLDRAVGGNFYLYAPNAPNFIGTYSLGFANSDFTYSCGASNSDVINNQNSNTNAILGSIVGGNTDIINNQNQNTNSIIGSIVGGNTDIINNQNQNTKNLAENSDRNTNAILGSIVGGNTDIINNQNSNSQKEIENANKNQQETNDRLDGINDSITDSTPPDVDNAFGDINLDKDSAISDLLLLPVKYLQRILNLSSKSCTDYSLNFGIFGSSYILKLPCINLQSFFGSQIWTTIDYLICFFMIYEIIMLFIKSFEDLTSLRDTYDSLYQPKHAEGQYQPRHGGGS